MGIVNATPDSFHPPSRGRTAKEAVVLALRLAGEGADLLDVGGESTRPGAELVPEEEEIARVVPVVAALAVRTSLPVSVDTRHAAVARAALDAGASVVNDMSGGADPAMAGIVRDSGAGWVLAYARALPAPVYAGEAAGEAPAETVVAEAVSFLEGCARRAVAAGIAPECLAVDPGIGFGTTPGQDAALVAALPRLAALGFPVLAGVSRKRFVSALSGMGATSADRLGGSLAAALRCARNGARILRVHDVQETRQALAVDAALAAAEAALPEGRG